MTTPTVDGLRQEARLIRATAKRIWAESEYLLARATALNRAARAIEAMADDREDIERVQVLAGRPVRLAKADRLGDLGELRSRSRGRERGVRSVKEPVA